MLSLHASTLLLLQPLVREAEAFEGAAPVFFGPCTLGRTWGTRPEPWTVVRGMKSADFPHQSNSDQCQTQIRQLRRAT